MAVWADLFPDFMGRLEGCPAPLAELELRRSAIRFFRTSRVWKVMLDTVTVPAGTAEFDLEADSATQQPVRVEKCWGNSAPLTVYTPDSMDADFKDNWMVHEGPPVGIVQMVPNIVRLYPIPLLEVSLSVRISVCPAENATSFPNEFLRYREAIVAGALGVLYTYDKEVWANSKQAIQFSGTADMLTYTAANEAAHSFGKGRVKSRPKWC